MKNYEEFKTVLAEGIRETFAKQGQEVKVYLHVVEKANVTYDALSVGMAESNCAININIEPCYDKFQTGASLDTIVEDVVRVAKKSFASCPSIAVQDLTDYNKMKNKLVVEAVSLEGNEEFLSKVPHKILLDLAIIYRAVVEEHEEGRGSMMISNQLLQEFGVTAEQLHTDAVINAETYKPVVIHNMLDMLRGMGMEIPESDLDPEFVMYVATVPDGLNGACVIAYPSFFEQASAEVGGSFYLIPSSRHEVIMLPDVGNHDINHLKALISEVNMFEVSAEDKLSDSLYHYDAYDQAFELVDNYIARVQA